MRSRSRSQAADLVAVGFVIDLTVVVLLIGASGLIAFLDHRRLQRDGLDRPFPWGWGFVSGISLVGRTIVLRRRTGRGAAPLILAAVVLVVTMLGLFVEFGIVVATALQDGAIQR